MANGGQLADYASDPARSRGRLHEEGKTTRGPRDAFQRDRDRIVHSISFRRLRHKTQVFVAPDGDHFRVRLTHSLEVAQIGRAMARALGLNEDLTEALCLAHDIGHPPFGHAGERALERALKDHGGFDHNAQTLRTLMFLERVYPHFDGLNLSWETLDGLAKHNGPVTKRGWAMEEANAAFDLDLARHSSLEAQIAAVSDDIAYDNHDIDDGLRAGLLTMDQLLGQPCVRKGWERIIATYPGVVKERLQRELVRDQIGQMVNDVIGATRARLMEHRIETAEDVRAAGLTLGNFSDVMQAEERALKRFMYDNLYYHPTQIEAADAADTVVSGLFSAYADDPVLMGEDWAARLPADNPQRARHIADYIAGMTDRFALNRFAEIYGAAAVPAGL